MALGGLVFEGGGEFKLAAAGVREAIREQIGKPLGLDEVEAAHGIFRIVNANMANAIRRVSSQAGFDPRDFTLLVYGGNGPVHASMQADELGIRSFWARPNEFNGRTLGDRYYDPIWELLQDLDVPFATHEFMGLNAQTEGVDRFNTFTEWHTVVHAHEAQNACLSMIVHGVFDRFPRLRCSYMEAGCGWLPSWLHRIDEHLEMSGAAEFPELTKTATEYFMSNCWITTECEDPFVADVIRWLGD